MTDTRRSRHWPSPTHQTEDDIPTLVPCFLCSGAGCEDCAGTGLVPPDVRLAQREAAGNPSSSEQCDTRRAP